MYNPLPGERMLHATTIIAVRKDGQVAMAGDGQVTIGDIVLKNNARKIRPLYQDRVLAGFAGAVADALTLFEKFEAQLDRYRGNLRKAAVELTKEWRTDRYLRRLEAQLIVADADQLLLLSGEGDVIEPDEGVLAIGSGGPYAQSAALALLAHTEMGAADVARAAMDVASRLCIFTNSQITLHVIEPDGVQAEEEAPNDLPAAEELPVANADAPAAAPSRPAPRRRRKTTDEGAGSQETGNDAGTGSRGRGGTKAVSARNPQPATRNPFSHQRGTSSGK